MKTATMKRAFALMALAASAASVAARAEGGLERAAASGDSDLAKQSLTLEEASQGSLATLPKAGTPNSADPYVPRRDAWGTQECLPGWRLVNRDYISPSAPGVVINPSCVLGGNKAMAAVGAPNSADPYVPRRDPWGYIECLPGWRLVNRDYISPSQPGVVINPSCIRGGGKALLAARVIGVPGHYYPGPIDNPPDVDCGVGRRLSYVGNDRWTCLAARGGHERDGGHGRGGGSGGGHGGHGGGGRR